MILIFNKQTVNSKSASNRFQPILCHKGILVSIFASKWTIIQIIIDLANFGGKILQIFIGNQGWNLEFMSKKTT